MATKTAQTNQQKNVPQPKKNTSYHKHTDYLAINIYFAVEKY